MMSNNPSLDATASTSAVYQEGTELQAQTRAGRGHNSPSIEGEQSTTQHQADHAQSRSEPGIIAKIRHNLKKFWSRQISLIVSHEGCRDHFGAQFSMAPCYSLMPCLGLYLDKPALLLNMVHCIQYPIHFSRRLKEMAFNRSSWHRTTIPFGL